MWTYKYLRVAPSLGLHSNLQRVCVSAVMAPALCCPISQECLSALVKLPVEAVISCRAYGKGEALVGVPDPEGTWSNLGVLLDLCPSGSDPPMRWKLCDYILQCARGFCSLYLYALAYRSHLTGLWIMPVHLNSNEITSVIVLASTGTFLKCPEGGMVGLLVFQTSRDPGSQAVPACQLLCCKRSQPCGHCFISKAAAQGMWRQGWSQELAYSEPPASRKELGTGEAWSAIPSPSLPENMQLCFNRGWWLAETCPYAWRAAWL